MNRAVSSVGLMLGQEPLPPGQVGRQRRLGRLAQKGQALLGSFAPDPEHARRQVQVSQVEPGQLGQAQAPAVKHLQDGLIPGVAEIIALGLAQQVKGLVHAQVVGQDLFQLGAGGQFRRVVGDDPLALQVFEEGAQGGELAGHRGLAVPLQGGGQKGPEVLVGHLRQAPGLPGARSKIPETG